MWLGQKGQNLKFMTKIVHVRVEVTIKAEIARVESVYVPSGGIRRIAFLSMVLAIYLTVTFRRSTICLHQF